MALSVNNGFVATGTGAGIKHFSQRVRNRSGSANNGFGIRSIGPNVTVRVDGSTIIGNGTGVSALSGGALLSTGNNMLQANGTNRSFTGAVPLN